MRFLSVYTAPDSNEAPTPEMIARMGEFIEAGKKRGILLATEGCMPSALGARMRLSDGKLILKDGPFTESKEVIGGFALLQANSKQEALDYVKQFLALVGEGQCELRQLHG